MQVQLDKMKAETKVRLAALKQESKVRVQTLNADGNLEVTKLAAEKERVLKEVHEIARVDVEKDIEKRVAGMRYKATSNLLQLEDTERKLARLHEFKEAAGIAAR